MYWSKRNPYHARARESHAMEGHLMSKEPRSSLEIEEFVCHRCLNGQERGRSIKALTGLALSSAAMLVLSAILLVTTMKYHKASLPALSPALRGFPIQLETRSWDLNFFNSESSSIYRQAPSPAVDEAWERLGERVEIWVDREDLERAGIDPERAVKPPASWNVTGEKYLAALDSTHQLHCLDTIRRSAFSEYYDRDGGLYKDAHLYWPHLNHCLDVVRESLMCHANTDLLIFVWRETQEVSFMPATAEHQCRDYEAVLKWQKDRAIGVDEDIRLQLRKPEDAAEYPMQKEFWDWFPQAERSHVDLSAAVHHHHH